VLLLIWAIVRIRVKRIQHRAELNQQLNELEMKALKSQMNPHFIYNALNSIQSLVMDGKQAEAVKYMSRFARLLRQVLEHSGANLITLEKELSMIDIYVQLEMLRMNAKLNYEVILDEQILTEREYIPPLILQPFIENALWHGLSRKEGEKNLRLEINADEEWLLIKVTDNGIGRQKAEELKSRSMDYPRSMGMEITGKRLKTVNHNHVRAIEFHDLQDIQGDPAGTQVLIKIRRHTHLNNGK
jgi:sensor histidine kinase YesM